MCARLVASFLYTALGREFVWKAGMVVPQSLEDKNHHAAFLKKLPQLVQEGVVKPLPIKVWEGGLKAIPDGLQWMREGNVSAQKIVYRL